MKYMVKWGLSPLQAIQASTINNAALFGLENDIGKIKDGYFADIIAVKDNPLENIGELEAVRFVMKGGYIIVSN